MVCEKNWSIMCGGFNFKSVSLPFPQWGIEIASSIIFYPNLQLKDLKSYRSDD